MPKIRSFDDLEVYRFARELRRHVYDLVDRLPAKERYGLIDQIKRSARSITSNVAEGYGRYHYQENIQFCRQARGSLYELLDQFSACLDQRYINGEELDRLKKETHQVLRLLNGYIAATQKRQKRSG